jgi:DNA topoisomerase IA
MIQVTVSIWFKSFNYLKILLNVYFRYGPCQTPTLGFCVQRYMHINTFKPEKFWALRPYIRKDGYELQLEWERRRLFDLEVSVSFLS